MNQEPLRWGIAGTGGIARRMTTALDGLSDALVAAVGSRQQSTSEAFVAEFGIARAHGSYQALFDDPSIDIIYVASPHSHHHDMTIAALEAGKHVVCEKAFALNAAQARSMVAAARRNNRFLMEAMWTWFIPAVVELKARIDAGSIGHVVAIDADFGLRIDKPDGRHRQADLGGGALLDLGIYPLTFACFVAGEHPDEIKTIGRLTDGGVDATIGGVAGFPSGIISTFHTTIEATTGMGARISGTEGRIDVAAPFWFTNDFTIHRNGSEPERVQIDNDGLAHEAAHAMARIRAGHLQSDVIDWETSIASMEMLDEVRRQVGVTYPVESSGFATAERERPSAP